MELLLAFSAILVPVFVAAYLLGRRDGREQVGEGFGRALQAMDKFEPGLVDKYERASAKWNASRSRWEKQEAGSVT
jgi:hypothetical protein